MPRTLGIVVALLGTLVAGTATAEPYFAARTGLKCGTCHVNDTGGGMRTAFGNQWAKTQLAADPLEVTAEAWTGQVSPQVAIGGNLRGAAAFRDPGTGEDTNEFRFDEMRLYLDFTPVPGRLDVYVDQQLAPGGSTNREAYVRLRSKDSGWYVKAGQMYLPFGWRLEDDTAFVRRVPGINMTTPDRGVEFGWDTASTSTQLAVSNGTAGAPENDDGKQLSLRSEWVQPVWRVGASVNSNDVDTGRRDMVGIFGAYRTGPVVWLAEYDRIEDDSFAAGTLEQSASLVEADWEFLQGHNLKVTGERFDPDLQLGGDVQTRVSLVWEYTPIQFMQVRVGTRTLSAPQPADEYTEAFIQWHGFY